MIYKLFHKCWTLLKIILIFLFSHLHVTTKKIHFTSFLGNNFDGDPLALAIQFLSSRYKLIIASNHNNAYGCLGYSKNIVYCNNHTLRNYFHLYTSRVWIDNARKSIVHKNKKILYINTWHGSGAIKKCENDAIDILPSKYVKNAKKDSKYCDAFVSDCLAMTNLFYKSFWFSNYIIKTCYPRNMKIAVSDCDIEPIKNKLGINKSYKVILYAPTFRNDKSFTYYIKDFSKIINTCQKRYNKNFVIIYRLHPNMIDLYSSLDKLNIINVTRYKPLNDLLMISDILISDYSSILYDFTLTNKPAFCFTPDMNNYDRGLYFNKNDYPWAMCYTLDDLCDCLENFDIEKYKEKCNNYFSKLGLYKFAMNENIIFDIVNDYLDTNISKEFLFSKYKNYIENKCYE